MLPLPLFNSVSLTVRQEKANLRVLKLLLYGRPGPLGLVILVLLLVTWVGGRPGRLPQCLTMEETGGHLWCWLLVGLLLLLIEEAFPRQLQLITNSLCLLFIGWQTLDIQQPIAICNLPKLFVHVELFPQYTPRSFWQGVQSRGLNIVELVTSGRPFMEMHNVLVVDWSKVHWNNTHCLHL